MLTYERFMKKVIEKKEPDPALLAWAESNYQRFAAVLDQNLGQHEFVAGNAFTLADLSIAPLFSYRAQAGLDLGKFPHLAAWLSRIEARPSWQQTKPPF
jgi:glutathione S-transferase